MIKRVRRRTTPEIVAEQIQNLINTGILKVGDQLPPERELAEQLGIGRLSLREAMRLLMARNMVEVRVGDGTYIKRMTSDDLAEPIRHFLVLNRHSIPDLVEARLVIEVQCAGLATERMDDSDRERLNAAMQRMEELARAGDWNAYIEADVHFHLILCEAAKNTILLQLLKALLTLVVETSRRKDELEVAVGRALVGHRRILKAVNRGDAQLAKSAMREHLEMVTWELEAPVEPTH